MSADEEEFTAIFDDVYPNLCRFLEGILGSDGSAQEIAQECFMKLYKKGLDDIKKGDEIFWLFRVARNLALNKIRDAKRHVGLAEKIKELFYKSKPTHDEVFETREALEGAVELLRKLPEHQRAVLILREQEEMNYREIARVLEISEAKVKVDIFRARNSLRTMV